MAIVTTTGTATRAASGGQPQRRRSGPARRLPPRIALLIAAGAGAALLVSFPPWELWFLAPVGLALLAVAVHRQRLRAGAGLGLLAGLVFFVPLLSWTNLHTGYLPWLLLSATEASYLALLGAAAAWVSPLADRYRAGWPVLTGLLWVGQEALRDRTPFGGFPWGRLAFSQGDSPLLRLAVAGGAPLVTFAVGVVGGLLAAAFWRLDAAVPHRPGSATPAGARWWPVAGGAGRWLPHRRSWLAAGGLTAAAAALTAAAWAVPVGQPRGAPVTVAVIQGNVPRLGLDFNAQRRAVLDNHVAATLALAGQVSAGQRPAPDLVVWPENASDIDPLRNPDAGGLIGQAADAVGAPILVGTLLLGPGADQIRNVGLVWRPGTGPEPGFYAKRHPVPFAEYIPLREIARKVSDKVDLVQREMVAGTSAGVLRVGPAVLGDVICFEVAYDGLVRDTVTGGAQLIAVQTNNATFNTAEATQQLAMVRLRAVEHGRPALMASTVGVSAFADPDGTVHQESTFDTRAVLVRQVRLSDEQTPADRLGLLPELVLAGLAGAGLVGAGLLRHRDSRGARAVARAGQQAAAGQGGRV